MVRILAFVASVIVSGAILYTPADARHRRHHLGYASLAPADHGDYRDVAYAVLAHLGVDLLAAKVELDRQPGLAQRAGQFGRIGVGVGDKVFVEDDLAAVIEDAEVPGPGMQIDAAVESVLLVVEAQGVLRRSGWGPEPAAWWEGASFLKIPRCDKDNTWIAYPWDRLPPVPRRP